MAEPSTPGGTPPGTGATDARQVLLQKFYLKDASIESPQSPKIFLGNSQPQIDVNVSTGMTPVQDDLFEVSLTVTVTAKSGEDTAFLVEVKQGGLFLLKGFSNPQEKGAVLGGYCPSMLFPFAREAVADFVQRAGFPQLLLQPINFEALYLQQLQEQRKKAGEGSDKVILDPSGKTAH